MSWDNLSWDKMSPDRRKHKKKKASIIIDPELNNVKLTYKFLSPIHWCLNCDTSGAHDIRKNPNDSENDNNN